MKLKKRICDRALLAKDPRFDGLFFIGVLSTGIYCRPICSARAAKRVKTIKVLSRAVACGEISLLVKRSLENFIKQLTRIPGIGDWTAQYIAMRALDEPDAFPAADLGIIKALQQGDKRPAPKQILERSEEGASLAGLCRHLPMARLMDGTCPFPSGLTQRAG